MEKIYVISECEVIKRKTCDFHFIGYYSGQRIKKIRVLGGDFIKGEEYLMALSIIEIRDGVLIGQHIKSKKLV